MTDPKRWRKVPRVKSTSFHDYVDALVLVTLIAEFARELSLLPPAAALALAVSRMIAE